MENQDWATEPPGRGAAWASGRRAAGPSRAVGGGPLGRGPAFSKTVMKQLLFSYIIIVFIAGTAIHIALMFSHGRSIFLKNVVILYTKLTGFFYVHAHIENWRL